MRIVSWNMNHMGRSKNARQEAWSYLRNELNADLALVQEASVTAGLSLPEDVTSVYRAIDETHRSYRWGSAVVSFRSDLTLRRRSRVPLAERNMTPLKGDEIPDSHPGASAIADVLEANGRKLLTAVSLYGQWEMIPGRGIYSCARLHRMLSDLTGVLAKCQRHPVVLAGDLNMTTQIAFEGQKESDTAGARAAFDRIRAWGMVDCVAQSPDTKPVQNCSCSEPDCRHVQTFRLKNKVDSRPTQLDYAFVSRSLMPRARSCQVKDVEQAWALSDHCPIVLDLDMSV